MFKNISWSIRCQKMVYETTTNIQPFTLPANSCLFLKRIKRANKVEIELSTVELIICLKMKTFVSMSLFYFFF